MLLLYVVLGLLNYGFINSYLMKVEDMSPEGRRNISVLVAMTGFIGFIGTMILGLYKTGWTLSKEDV